MSAPRVLAAVTALAALAGACANGGDSGPAASSDESFSRAEFVADLAPADAAAVAASVNAFGFDLLGELSDGAENAVTSPVSVATLLAMVLAGADGDTAEAMAETLRLENSRDVRVGALLDELTSDDGVTLSVANALWADDGVELKDDYAAFVRDVFDATVETADLGAAETAEDIDAWVKEHTEGLIDGIAEDLGLPNPKAVLALVNAVYFLGEWTTAFDPDQTRDAPFTLGDGSQVEVPMMSLTGQEFAHAQRDGYRMLRLPYGEDGRFGMELLLPDENSSLPGLLASLDAEEWRAALDGLAVESMDVELPRLELSWEAKLNDALSALGMGTAFSGGGDFSPMSSAASHLDTVVHKTYIRVDERGTEAAAVTGGVVVTSAPPGFRVDRPFAFTISDRETGAVLFLGAVADPRS